MANKKRIFIFGNQDIKTDSLPIRVFPKLKRRFPDVKFEIKDPNEELEIPEEFTAVDTVSGIKRVRVFSDISLFAGHPNVSLHDFDFYSHLKYLEKLGKLKRIKIIGVPPTISEKEAFAEIAAVIRSI